MDDLEKLKNELETLSEEEKEMLLAFILNIKIRNADLARSLN